MSDRSAPRAAAGIDSCVPVNSMSDYHSCDVSWSEFTDLRGEVRNKADSYDVDRVRSELSSLESDIRGKADYTRLDHLNKR